MSFKFTVKQLEAAKLISTDAKYTLLYGGSRSGKSFIIICAIILRAIKVDGSRHLVCRFAFNHAKQSLWHDTIPKVLKLCFPGVKPILNKSDWFIEFPNGSQIWLGGLDDKERTEKVLGNEYSTIFINECSQVSYASYSTLLTRLAQKTDLVNRVYCDCNPPSTQHWSYKLFIQHVNPESNEALDSKYYSHMRMNPDDNLENLPEDYIEKGFESIKKDLGEIKVNKPKRFSPGEKVLYREKIAILSNLVVIQEDLLSGKFEGEEDRIMRLKKMNSEIKEYLERIVNLSARLALFPVGKKDR
jgi:PBSX family phage terminase large subunit